MRKALAILLVTSYLFTSTELSQLLKLPEFVTHFIEHKAQNNDLTLWQFLCVHYTNGNVKDADYDQDMKLPFKTHDNCSTQISIAVPPTFLGITTKAAYLNVKRNTHILTNESPSSAYLSSIWQPPKSC